MTPLTISQIQRVQADTKLLKLRSEYASSDFVREALEKLIEVNNNLIKNGWNKK